MKGSPAPPTAKTIAEDIEEWEEVIRVRDEDTDRIKAHVAGLRKRLAEIQSTEQEGTP